MVSELSMLCVQVAVVILNCIYGLLSIPLILWAVILGTGSVLASYDYSLIDLAAILDNPFLLIACSIMFGTAILALCMSVVGCIGAGTTNPCFLRMTFVVVVILFLVKFVGVILVTQYTGTDVQTSVIVQNRPASVAVFQDKYNMTEGFTTAFDRFQSQKNCCGIDSKSDFLNGWSGSCCEDGAPPETCKTFDNGCRSDLKDLVLLDIVVISTGLLFLSLLELFVLLSTSLLLRLKVKGDYDNFEDET